MAKGSPDWTNAVRLVAVDDEGNEYPVTVTAEGRLEAVIVGAGENTLAALTVDEGRLIAVIQGADSENIVKIDTGGRMQVRLVAMVDEEVSHDVTVDGDGHLLMRPIGREGEYLHVDSDGFLTVKIKGHDGTGYQDIRTDGAGRMEALMKGTYNETLKTVSLDADGRMETVVKGTKDVTRGLRLWYKFNSVEGSNIRDSSPWGNDGISYSGVTPTTFYKDGVVGQSIGFDGIDDHVITPDADSISLGVNEDFTLEAWIKLDSFSESDWLRFIFKAEGAADPYMLGVGFDYDRKVKFQLAAGLLSSITALDTLTWYHIVATRKDNVATLYIDGEYDNSGAITTQACGVDGNLVMGLYPPADVYWPGGVDEVRIYGLALTADEVAIRYNLTKPGGTGALQEITVNARGQMEVQGRDESAILRNLLVDTAGRLIIVPRGESGYYLDVDSDGFMTAKIKGHDGTVYRNIRTDGAGRMEALMKGMYDTALKTIATDSDGVMLANIRGMPYENILFDEDHKAMTSGVSWDIYFGPVPAGEIWVITTAYMYIQSGVCERMEIRLNKKGSNYACVSETPEGGTNSLNFSGHIFFDATSRIFFHFLDPTLDASGWAGFNGYIVKAYA